MIADELFISLDTYYFIVYKGVRLKQSKHPLAHHASTRPIHRLDVAQSVCNGFNVAMDDEQYLCGIQEVEYYTIQNHWGIISTMYSKFSASIAGGEKKISKKNLKLAHYPFPLELIINPYFETYEQAEKVLERLKNHIKTVVELGLAKHWRAESEPPWTKPIGSERNSNDSLIKKIAPKKPELTKTEYSQGLKNLGFLPVSLNPYPNDKPKEIKPTKKEKKNTFKKILHVKSVGRAKG